MNMYNDITPGSNIVTSAVSVTTTTEAKASNFVKGQDSALALAKQGFHVFPLSPGSKVPPKGSNGSKDATAAHNDILFLQQWQSEYGVGIATGHDGLLVFDLDTDKKWQATGRISPTDIFQSQSGKRLATLFGDRINDMRWLATPSGGVHFYGRVTGIPVGTTLKCGTDVLKSKTVDGVALDLRGNGGYVAAYNGGSDGIRNDQVSVHDLPTFTWQELVDAGIYSSVAAGSITSGQSLGPTPIHDVAQGAPLGALALPERPDRVREALRALIGATAPTVRGGRDWWRDNILFPLATAVRNGELPEAVAYDLFTEASAGAGGDTSKNDSQWRSTIDAPLTGGERSLGSLYHAAKAAGWVESSGMVQSDSQIGALSLPDTGGAGGKRGSRRVALASLVGALTHADIGCSFNERIGKFEVCIPDGLRWQGRAGECEPLDDATVRQLALKLSENGIEVTDLMLGNALKTIGDQHAYDPVKEYFVGVRGTWDGVKRIDTWLTTYAGADDKPLVRGVGVHFLVGAVKRTFQPGVQHDEVLTLIGGQGAGKSTLGRVLATIRGKAYFSDADVMGQAAREVLELTSGSLIHEFGEVKLTGKDGSKAKDLLSRTSDKGRRAFAHFEVDTPRRFVFLATGNNPVFLTDVTGNRRWHVVEVCTQPNAKGQAAIDLDGLANDRDQIWAEAVEEYHRRRANGRLGFDDELWEAAAEAASKARVTDPWEELLPQIAYGTPGRWTVLTCEAPVKGMMGAFTPVMFIGSTGLLAQVATGHPGGDSRANAMRLAKAAKAVGWVTNRRRVDGLPVSGFLVPPQRAFDGGEDAPP